MELRFDPTNNSIQIEHTAAEYLEALKSTGIVGATQYWFCPSDSIDQKVKYRHEHAHFSSFNSTGLIELQAVFHDYKLFLSYFFLVHHIRNSDISSNRTLEIPIISSQFADGLNEIETLYLAALRSVNSQEALFLGWGTNASVSELFDFKVHEDYHKILGLPPTHPSISRYRKFCKQMRFTTPEPLYMVRDTIMPKVEFTNGEIVNITSRSVIESYAISMEVLAEYSKAETVNLNKKRDTPKRVPNRNNLIPIGVILDKCYNRKYSIENFLSGKLPAKVYHVVNLIATASMQVPVLEDIDGESICMGSIKQLCPAHRFVHIFNNIETRVLKIPRKSSDFYDNDLIINWLDNCHKNIGDPWSIKLYQHISRDVLSRFSSFTSKDQFYSMHKTSWIGRLHFYNNPSSFITEAGIRHYTSGFQVKYVKTIDNKLFGQSSVDTEGMMVYLADSALHLLEAVIIGDKWVSGWKRIGLNAGNDETKKMYLKAILVYYNIQLSDMIDQKEGYTPEIIIKGDFVSA